MLESRTGRFQSVVIFFVLIEWLPVLTLQRNADFNAFEASNWVLFPFYTSSTILTSKPSPVVLYNVQNTKSAWSEILVVRHVKNIPNYAVFISQISQSNGSPIFPIDPEISSVLVYLYLQLHLRYACGEGGFDWIHTWRSLKWATNRETNKGLNPVSVPGSINADTVEIFITA